jgi:hypothetical protein
MRKALMIASAAAMALSMPAMAEKGGKGGGHGGGNPHKVHGGGGGGHGGGKPHKMEFRGGGGGGGHARHEFKARGRDSGGERALAGEARRDWSRPAKAQKRFAKAERRFTTSDRSFAKAERKALKSEATRAARFARSEERRIVGDQPFRPYAGQRVRDDQIRYASGFGDACPPGLARKNNGCLPPGQAKKAFGIGALLPAAYHGSYNLPSEYQSWYQDTPDHYYRYDDSGYIYQVGRQSSLIESLIPLLGGGFGVGQLLPAGYDVYNLPTQYRDDFVDSEAAHYRYGDDAIYQVDPQSGIIESIVALLAGNLNVGQALPSGYDVYNLPTEYRDDYVDDSDSMYRYADGNIYEVDPRTRIIEQIVASLV